MAEERLKEFKLKFPDILVSSLKENTDIILNTVGKDEERIMPESYLDLEIKNAYDFSDKVVEYFNRDIERYKGKYKGRRCFIVATGPSLTMDDLGLLEENEEICFSMNRIYCAFKSTKWRPDFYVVSDRKMLGNYWNDILELKIKDKFISDRIYLFEDKQDSGILKNNNLNLYHIQGREMVQGNILFSENCAKRCYEGGTVTYICLQLAAYMGFSEIYLLGLDCNYVTDGSQNQNYFCKDYVPKGKKGNVVLPKLMISAYQVAKRYAEENNIKIYNATRGGKLEVFERVALESLFK